MLILPIFIPVKPEIPFNPMYRSLFTFCLGLILTDCSQVSENNSIPPANRPKNEALLMATLYQYYAAEYKALCFQAYNIATQRLEAIRSEKPLSKNLAVVVDIDETVLDNSPYQALLIQEGINYDSCWDTWCKLAVARPVAGSLDFLRRAAELEFTIFYLSNRKEHLREATLQNLQNLGFPQSDSLHLLLREGNQNSKEERRNRLREYFEIVLFAGDNLGDFFDDAGNYDQRDSLVIAQEHNFSDLYIVLPNAMYGNWPASLGIEGNRMPYDSLLDLMTLPFYEN
jgi:5'-nucleotidase (lipoprotein e(P4) family)